MQEIDLLAPRVQIDVSTRLWACKILYSQGTDQRPGSAGQARDAQVRSCSVAFLGLHEMFPFFAGLQGLVFLKRCSYDNSLTASKDVFR